jgi:hypothetical protein
MTLTHHQQLEALPSSYINDPTPIHLALTTPKRIPTIHSQLYKMADTMTGNTDAQQYAAIQPRMSPPTAGPGSHTHGLPAQNNNTSTTLAPTMAQDPEATPTLDDISSSRKRDADLRAQANESRTQTNKPKTQPSRASSDRNSQQPEISNNSNNTKNRNTGPSKAPTPATAPSYDTSITIQALQQQLFIAEHHQTQIRYEAAQQFHQLQTVIRSTYDRATHLEGNVHYLSAELEKANSYNATLNEHVRGLRADMEVREVQHKAALKAAKAKAAGSKGAAAGSSSARILAAPTPTAAPIPTPAVTLSLNDARTRTLLEHNRTTIRSLRTEIRTLKTANKQVQDRLLELRSEPDVDSRAVLQNSGVPGDVLREWSEVLLEKDREIAGLGVLLGREREAR